MMKLSNLDKFLTIIAIVLGVILIGLSYNLFQRDFFNIDFKKILIGFFFIFGVFILGFLTYKLLKEKVIQINFLGILEVKLTLNHNSLKEKIHKINPEKILIVIAIILGLVILGLVFSKFYLDGGVVQYKERQLKQPTKEYPLINYSEFPKASVPILNISNINLSKIKIISKNPDLIFNKSELIELNASNQKIKESIFRMNSITWSSDGFYYKNSLPNGSKNYGIVIIHPHDRVTPRFLEQDITNLPNGSILFLRVGDVERYLADIGIVKNPCYTCADAIIKVLIINMENNSDGVVIYEDVVDSREGWRDIVLNITKFAGENITLKVEGYAGGPCGEWCGELMAVDIAYVGVIK